MADPRTIADLQTPALVVERQHLRRQPRHHGGRAARARLRPHVKAHKCTALAQRQAAAGHRTFTLRHHPRRSRAWPPPAWATTCSWPTRSLDARRLGAVAASTAHGSPSPSTREATIAAAAAGGVREVLVDVDVGLPRCGCAPDDAGRLADRARAAGLGSAA